MQKFFVTAAFPYATPMKPDELLTRLRNFVLADVYARYNKALGKEVLFPIAFHYTGSPLVSFFESLQHGDEEAIRLAKEFGIGEVKSPKELGDKVSEKIKEVLKALEVSVDWSRSFTTDDPGFKSFVSWVLNKIKEKGYIIKGTYPVPWDPVKEVPIGPHDTKGFVQIRIGSFYTLLFELKPNLFLPAATRPETVFGITNIWVNPRSKYKIVDINGKRLIVSEKAAFKLRHQIENVIELDSIDIEEILGMRATNPVTGERVPVLPASFVNPNLGTGVVASKPAHDINDYRAVKELLKRPTLLEAYGVKPEELEPKVVIELPECKVPAECFDDQGKLTLAERERGKLKEEAVLKALKNFDDPFLKGLLIASLVERSVKEASEIIRRATEIAEISLTMYDILNGPVYSRYGYEVVVKVLKDQWFLNYDDEKWKREALEALSLSDFMPKNAKKVVVDSIEKQRKRVIGSRGLGTPIPWDKSLTVDNLTDSTLYYIFYIFSPKLRNEELSSEEWDYLIFGKGEKEELRELRKEFLKWMPLDLRVVHEELLRNHVAFMYFHHAAVFKTSNVPKRIMSVGPVTSDLYPWELDSLGLRSYLIAGAKPESHLKVTKEEVESMKSKLNSVVKFKDIKGKREKGELEAWLSSTLAKRAERARFYIEQGNLREAFLELLGFSKDLGRYLLRLKDKGLEPAEISDLISAWGSYLMPFVPSIGKELGGKEEWPELERDLEAEAREVYFDILLNYVANSPAEEVVVKVAPKEKMRMLVEAVEAIDEGVLEDLEGLPEEIRSRAFKLGEDLRELIRYIDEERLANEFKGEIERRTGKKIRIVVDEGATPLDIAFKR